MATGHYARVFWDPVVDRWILARAGDGAKDQTYALYATKQSELAHMWMPLGDLTSKAQTREVARAYGLGVAEKPDSQEICFVKDRDYGAFLSDRVPEVVAAGDIVDSAGTVRGRHDGVAFYTVGQRKRINVGSALPLYVLHVDAASKTVVVGSDEELYAPGCFVDDLNWVSCSKPPLNTPIDCAVKIRYNMPSLPARLERGGDDSVRVLFETPLRAVAPGQAAVFYGVGEESDRVLGGGTIIRSAKE